MKSMKRILLIDSDAVTGELTKKFLKNFNYNVDLVTTGKMALDLINQSHYDLVLSDTEVNGLGGFDVLKIMRKCFIDVPFAFFTVNDDVSTGIEAESLGAVKVISKRTDYINLPHILDNYFYRSHNMVA